MYFYVREGFALSQVSEGFCTNLQVTSEMLNGEVIVDGYWRRDMGIGDSFELTTGPQFDLDTLTVDFTDFKS